MLVAAPAHAVTPLAGVVLDQGLPVNNATTRLYLYDAATTSWGLYDQDDTDATGTWNIASPAVDGRYALYYDVDDTAALFSSNQGFNGALTAQDLTTQFVVSGGNANIASFSQTLLRNAGIVQVSIKDGNSATPLTGTAVDGEGSLTLGSNYTPADGYVPVGYTETETNAAFDGTLALGHVVAGTYYQSYVDGTNSGGVDYESEALDPVKVTVGGTTFIPDVKLYPNGTANVSTVLPAEFEPVVTGVAKVGSLLTGATLPSGATLSYQWLTNDGWIENANTLSYLPTPNDLGDQFYLRVIARQPGYVTRVYFSDDTKPVVIGDGNVVTVAVSGTASFGKTLKATVTQSLTGSTNSYRWYRNGAPIAGADGSRYVLRKADVGESVFVAVKSTVQGHTDSVTPSAPRTIAKDTAVLRASTDRSITRSVKPKVKVTLRAGDSKNSARGKVRVYYTSTKFKTVTIANNSTKTVTVPTLSRGLHILKVRYLGNANYKVKTINVRVRVS